ncbi:MAG: hypothetical protein BRC31_02340 [Actinobacteria bacterium QS_5_72_10]|nr:MAG: hypothetical protein BRC32_04720 [Actinobacteria bacterium QS_8_72_14]PSO54019.1 MAG: hypothetical protein BRC31_02340 [Actinobacteria bacterium QS_5_72_10]
MLDRGRVGGWLRGLTPGGRRGGRSGGGGGGAGGAGAGRGCQQQQSRGDHKRCPHRLIPFVWAPAPPPVWAPATPRGG